MKKGTFLLLASFFIQMCFVQLSVAQIMIDAGQKYQTMVGFSASDCWTGHFVGSYWNDTQKNQIAKYLFSQNIKGDGNPEGIGLSMWRVNLGAGTMEQGANSNIEDIARRGECFLEEDGNYNWSKQAGQQWFMQKAKDYGCDQFVFFSNSPLVRYTLNGKGYSGSSNSANLQADKYDDFADYLATVVEHFTQQGYNIPYISPVNEPQWGWNDPGQEGSPWTNAEIKKLVVELDKSIREKELDTKILVTEAADYKYLYSNTNHRAGNQIYQFFGENSTNYIGNLTTVAPVIAGHSYWTHGTNANIRDIRSTVKTYIDRYKVGFFQTEWSLLGDAPGENFPGYDNASYMDIALVLARLIHSDLAYADASSWSYWTAMGSEQWGHKDRFLLLSLAPGSPPNAYNPITEPGMVYDRSTLWALGNYSLFVRPGYQRIQLTGADNLGGLMGTAYLAPDQSKIVAVYVNMANATQKIKTDFTNLSSHHPVKNKIYITNASYNLQKYGSASSEKYDPEKEISIPARSVVTIVYELEPTTGIMPLEKESLQIYPNPVSAFDKLNIKLPDNKNSRLCLSVYSSQGDLIYTEKKNNPVKDESISLPDQLQKGIYFLKTQYGDTIYYNKLFVN
jgi:O-glycosyl hydrolase